MNVHPTKLEVKFDDEDSVFTELHLAVKKTLDSSELIERHGKTQGVLAMVLKKTKPASKAIPLETTQQSMLVTEKKPRAEYRILGQIARSYIIAEVADGLLIIDQHAAAERINLEKIHKHLNVPGNSQQLLQPVVVSPPKHHVPLIKEHIDFLKQLGFDIFPKVTWS